LILDVFLLFYIFYVSLNYLPVMLPQSLIFLPAKPLCNFFFLFFRLFTRYGIEPISLALKELN
jgi:hypothetical protein